jgi:phage shock protein PspC (stress-responsive transcriptional regulator)
MCPMDNDDTTHDGPHDQRSAGTDADPGSSGRTTTQDPGARSGSDGPPPPTPPRLQRHTGTAVLGGVCAGLGRHLRVDPVLIRIAFIVLAFTGGVGILGYFVAWIAIPGDDGGNAGEEMRRAARGAPTWLQVVAVVVVALFVAGQLDGTPSALAWAAVLIGAGIVLYRDSDRPRAEHQPAAQGGPRGHDQPPAASEGPPPQAEAGAVPPARHWGPSHGWGGWGPHAPTHQQTYESPPRPRSVLGRLTVAAILLWCGVAALLDTAGLIAWDPRHYVAAATVITGMGLLVGAWWGRARALIFLGLALLPVLLLAGSPTGSIRSGVGERVYRPETLEDVRSQYELLAGEMTIDLSGVALRERDVDLDIRLGFGELTVIAPPGAEVNVTGTMVAGDSDVFGHIEKGTGIDHRRQLAGAGDAGTLNIHIEQGVGALAVRHPR